MTSETVLVTGAFGQVGKRCTETVGTPWSHWTSVAAHRIQART
ncbi:hypothetical protein MMMB2_3078 [Mycobacterium marinum MB2]|nr:hypothetical protein MMMB2_3078 [Mycobacterium marinum MB2]